MVSDSIADFCIRIKNGYLVHKKQISMPYSKIKEEMAKILVHEGYLNKIKNQKSKIKNREVKELIIELKYDENGQSAIAEIVRVSKPGLRVYKKYPKILRVLSGFGLAIVSTSKGLMTDKNARKNKLGGEILFQIW